NSVELHPAFSTNSMTDTIASSVTVCKTTAPLAAKKSHSLAAISTSPPGSASMDDATMGRPHASPTSSTSSTSSSSPSFSSTSISSSPMSSTFSLPDAASGTATSSTDNKNKGKEVDRNRASICGGPSANQIAQTRFCATHLSSIPTADMPQQHYTRASSSSASLSQDDMQHTATATAIDKGTGKGKSSSYDLYTHDSARSSNSSSLSSLPSVQEEVGNDEYSTSQFAASATFTSSTKASASATGKGKATRSMSSYGEGLSSGSGSGSGTISSSSLPRVASVSSHAHSGDDYVAGGSSGSGSSSKPCLNRAVTGPASSRRPFPTTRTSSSPVPQIPNVPNSAATEQDIGGIQDLSHFSYDTIPADFDFGDLPFYDTDPRTGIIYGDPHAITRPYLVPEVHYDLYRLNHDEADPRRTNIFNKHGTLLYYHPGRHIGQEQDSLRSQIHNQAMWTTTGRTSTWGTLTATEMATKRQIKIVQEATKKKTDPESLEPLARFVFRWKEDDFVVEYRKQKDQYRITCSQMCGGESKWKAPQSKPTQTMFHGMGMEGPGNPHIAISLGQPSPFDPTRYLQLISEYRLNSGPVQKRGDFELHNPDTFPAEFRSFLVLLSIVILDVMRPVDDKLFYKEFPQAALKSHKVAGTGGLRIHAGAMIPNSGDMAHMAIVGQVGSASAATLMVGRSSPKSTASLKASTVSSEDVSSSSSPTMSLPAAPMSTSLSGSKTAPPAPVKISRWTRIFKK
ncbi:hypothetical protein BGX28_010378, partial [Mortierella sp. GBA30]